MSTVFADAVSFLYTGAGALQSGVAAGTIVPTTASALVGQVQSDAGTPLSDVSITVADHPEFGTTTTQSDGTFAMAVNGGQSLRVRYTRAGYLPVERRTETPWQDYAPLPTVVLKTVDPQVTTVSSAGTALLAVRGSLMADTSGSRRATLLIPAGTDISLLKQSESACAGAANVAYAECVAGRTPGGG